MNLKQHMHLQLQSERDKQIWTDKDMWKAGIIGFLFGIVVGWILSLS